MTGKLHPEIKVGMRKVLLTPTVTVEDGKRTVKENAPIYVYDTSGPYSDPNVKIDLKQGLPRMRESWILQRDDVEQLDGLTSEYGRMRQEDKSLDHLRFSHIQTALSRQGRTAGISNVIMPNRASSLRKWNM